MHSRGIPFVRRFVLWALAVLAIGAIYTGYLGYTTATSAAKYAGVFYGMTLNMVGGRDNYIRLMAHQFDVPGWAVETPTFWVGVSMALDTTPNQPKKSPKSADWLGSSLTPPSQIGAEGTAADVVKQYYVDWNSADYSSMYALLSDGFKQSHPFDAYARAHANVSAITVDAQQSQDDPATVAVKIFSSDREADGTISHNTLTGTWTLVNQGGSWKLDSESVQLQGTPMQAIDKTAACANSPYKVGDMAKRLGPPGDQFYNTLRITKVYMEPGKTDAEWCALGATGSCGPEPHWYAKTAGWLYEARGDRATGLPTSYLRLTNGYEMDGPMGFVATPLAREVIARSVRCE